MSPLSLFGKIAWTVVLPVFIIIGLGYLLRRAFRLNLDTMNKLNLYALAPGIVFTKILDSDISAPRIGEIAVAWTALTLVLWAVSSAACRLARLPRGGRSVVEVGAMFPNVGNFGIPVAQLAFGAPGVAVQAIVMAIHNALFFTVGTFVAGGGATRAREALAATARLPFIYAIAAAFILRANPGLLPSPLRQSISLLGDGLIPLALMTLGAQLGARPLPRFGPVLQLSSLLRLVVAPAVAWAICLALGLDRPLAAMLTVAAACPVAVNVLLIAMEFRRGAALSSAAVAVTTVLSAATVTATIALVRLAG